MVTRKSRKQEGLKKSLSFKLNFYNFLLFIFYPKKEVKQHVKYITTNQLNTDNNTRNIIIQKSRIKNSNYTIHNKYNLIYLWDDNPINKLH